MIHLYFFLLLLSQGNNFGAANQTPKAQAINFSQLQSDYSKYKSDTAEESSMFNYWQSEAARRVNPDGSFGGVENHGSRPASCDGNWTQSNVAGNQTSDFDPGCPHEPQNAGRINSVAFTDGTHWIAGSEGGAYYCADNKIILKLAQTYHAQGMKGLDNLFSDGVAVIKVAPSNSNFIYVASGQSVSNYGWGSFAGASTGVYATASGVAGSFVQILSLTPQVYTITDMAVNPSNEAELWIVAHCFFDSTNHNPGSFGKVYHTTDAGTTWDSLQFYDNYFWSVCYSPDGKSLYLSGHYQYKSLDDGKTWTNISSMFGSKNIDTTVMSSFIELAVPPIGSPSYYNTCIIACSMDKTNNGYGNPDIWISTDGFASVAARHSYTQTNSNYAGAWALHPAIIACGIAPPKGLRIYLGGITLGRWFNYYFTFYLNNPMHDDIRCMTVPPYNGKNAGAIKIGTDGGLFTSSDGGVTITCQNAGLNCGEFDDAEATDNGFIIGSQDNANFVNENGIIKQYAKGDGGVSMFDELNPKKFYTQDFQNVGHVFVSQLGQCQYQILAGQDTLFHFSPIPMVLANDGINLYIAMHDVYRFGTQTDTWATQISDFKKQFGVNCGAVSCIEVARDSYQTIYAGTQGAWMVNGQVSTDYNNPNGYEGYNLFKSTDLGMTWKNISPQVPTVKGTITSILADDSGNVYIAYGNYSDLNNNNENIFYCFKPTVTHDLWANQSAGLPKVPTTKIIADESGSLYCSTDDGIYYTNSSFDFNWKCFNSGMPLARINNLSEHNGTIYAATWGRGLWTSPIIGQQPETRLENTPILPLSNARWTVEQWFDGQDSIVGNVFDYNIEGDTMISGTNYVKTNGFCYRTDGEKAYFRSPEIANDSEKLMLDFSLNVGDTLWNVYGGIDTSENLYCWVDGIDSIEINGIERKRMHITSNDIFGTMRQPCYWIEGVGNSAGFYEWMQTYDGDIASVLTCFFEDSHLDYSQPSPDGRHCETVSGISSQPQSNIIAYSTNGQIIVKNNSQQAGNLTIYNISGQPVIYAYLPISSYDISQKLIAGVYVVRFNSQSIKILIP